MFSFEFPRNELLLWTKFGMQFARRCLHVAHFTCRYFYIVKSQPFYKQNEKLLQHNGTNEQTYSLSANHISNRVISFLSFHLRYI